MEDVPNAFVKFVVFTAAITDLQKAMQKAEDRRDSGEQRLPRVLRGEPSIRVDGLGLIVWRKLTRFLGEDSVSFLKV